MSKKYLNTKEGSLEESILGLWEKAADEKMEASGDKNKYQKFFKSALKKFGVKSPAELKGEKKKEFFDYVDKNYVGDHEESKSVNEILPALAIGGRLAATGLARGAGAAAKVGARGARGAARGVGTVVKKIKKKSGVPQKDEAAAAAAGMAAHGFGQGVGQQVGKPLAKKIDKKLNAKHKPTHNEARELGTKEDRDEKLDLTPGQSKEDFEKQMSTMQEKNNSMRKALADIWGVGEGNNPFEKKEQKKPKKENKKTMTGKPETKVEVDPDVKEKMTIVR